MIVPDVPQAEWQVLEQFCTATRRDRIAAEPSIFAALEHRGWTVSGKVTEAGREAWVEWSVQERRLAATPFRW